MASIFAKAVNKAAGGGDAGKPKRKSTMWTVGAGNADQEREIAAAIHGFVELHREAKTIEGKMQVLKGKLAKHCEQNFVRDYAQLGVPPETPMILVNGDGEKVTYVVQDRSSQSQVSDDQLEMLTELLGEDRAAQMVGEEVTFAFNRVLMGKPGVAERIGTAIEGVIGQLLEEGLLTGEEAEEVIEAKQRRAFKPNTLDLLAHYCGRDSVLLGQVLAAMGSSVTRYVKA